MSRKITIIGAGMMGSGIAAIAALAGNQVSLVSTSLDSSIRGKLKAIACLNELYQNELTFDDPRQISDRIICAQTMEEALDDAEIVIEAVYEDLELKKDIFHLLDSLLPPEVPILSNTSGLRITDIASKANKHPERTMTAHFWLPAHLIPLVEIVMWEKTDFVYADNVRILLETWGKAPVIVRKDYPGQLANRILQAIIREATNIVDMGLASAEDVDKAIKMGMGIRLPVYGPLEHIDIVGLDLASSVQSTVLPWISGTRENSSLEGMVTQGYLGSKNGKGYYDWNSEKNLEEVIKKRNEFIIYALKKINR